MAHAPPPPATTPFPPPTAGLSAVLYIRNNSEWAHWSQRTRKYKLHYDEVQEEFLGPPHGRKSPMIWIYQTRFYWVCLWAVMSRCMTKPTKWHVRPAKTQISLGIRPVWSETSLWVQWVAKDPMLLHVYSEDSGQTGRMPRLIWVFAGRIDHFVGFDMRQL